MSKALQLRQQINDGILAAGYRYVTVDLAGFKKRRF